MEKKLTYFEKKIAEELILNDINEIKEFKDVESYINANFHSFLISGEYDDNSLDLNYNYKMLKEIESDEQFLSKLNFVLDKYVRF